MAAFPAMGMLRYVGGSEQRLHSRSCLPSTINGVCAGPVSPEALVSEGHRKPHAPRLCCAPHRAGICDAAASMKYCRPGEFVCCGTHFLDIRVFSPLLGGVSTRPSVSSGDPRHWRELPDAQERSSPFRKIMAPLLRFRLPLSVLRFFSPAARLRRHIPLLSLRCSRSILRHARSWPLVPRISFRTRPFPHARPMRKDLSFFTGPIFCKSNVMALAAATFSVFCDVLDFPLRLASAQRPASLLVCAFVDGLMPQS